MFTYTKKELEKRGYILLENGGLVAEKASMKPLTAISGKKAPGMKPNLENEDLCILYCLRDGEEEKFIPCNTLEDMVKIHEKYARTNQETSPWFSGYAVKAGTIPSNDIRMGIERVGKF